MKINQYIIVSLCIVGLTLQASPRAEKIERIAERNDLHIVYGAIQSRNHATARFEIVDGIIIRNNASVDQAAPSPVPLPERVATSPHHNAPVSPSQSEKENHDPNIE